MEEESVWIAEVVEMDIYKPVIAEMRASYFKLRHYPLPEILPVRGVQAYVGFPFIPPPI